VLFLDAMTIDLRRDTVANEVAYFAAGINEDGYREVLSFQIGGNQPATVWGEILEDIKDRGAREVLLVVTDGSFRNQGCSDRNLPQSRLPAVRGSQDEKYQIQDKRTP